MALTLKQEAFVDEYFKHEGNCYAAALAAGYTKATAKSASRWLDVKTTKNYNKKSEYKPEVASAIDARREQLKSARIADAQEIMEYLTSVVRGESRASVVVIEGYGDGCSEAKIIEKPPDEKERTKAAELLGRRYGVFTDKVDVGGALPVVISGGEVLED